jgi:penicillin-binding protein 2
MNPSTWSWWCRAVLLFPVPRLVITLSILLLLVGCSPAQQTVIVVQPLPTRASLEQPPTLDSAALVAINFLESWKLGDYPAMYNLITYSSREATSPEVFTSAYQNAADEMTFASLSYTPGASLYRDPARADVVHFNYNMTFQTRLLGEFSDADRNMQLVYDASAADWRVAWTPADIFALLAGGGQLRREISIPSRANIYDRKGRVLADQSGRVVVVKAVKQEIQDWPTCLPLLATAMNKDPQFIQGIYDRSSPDWLIELGIIEAVIYQQQHTQMESVCAAQFDSRPVRQYSNGTAAANIVGTVGYPDQSQLEEIEAQGFNSDTILGKSGIEASWDETLHGKPGGRLIIVSPGGDLLREVTRTPSQPPQSVWLTIDIDLQLKIQKILADYWKQLQLTESKGGSAVILDIHSGAVLALVSYPTYDANVLAPFSSLGTANAQRILGQLEADAKRPLLNRPTQGIYTLGSVMKLVSSMAVADSGVYALDQAYVCSGIWTREENFTRYDWLTGGHGRVNLQQALERSCNPYYYEVGYQMNQYDPDALPGYMQRFFGNATGMADLVEAAGFIPDPEWKRRATGYEWTFSDAANIAIGQGEVQVTPLQVARMVASIANGGTLYRPQLVAQTGILGEAATYSMTPNAIGDIDVKPEVLEVIRSGMCDVTTKQSGTAEFQFRDAAELQTIGVCGKTGTAQDNPRPAHAWFVAYAPRENPEIAIVVMVENGREGSGTAAPIVRDILDYYFFEYDR